MRRLFGPAVGAACLGVVMAAAGAAAAGGKVKAVARCVSVDGVLLGKGKSWQPVKAAERLAAGTHLIALPQAELRSENDAVQVHLITDIGRRGPFPVLETAVIVSDHADADLELSLLRGVVVLTNTRKSGEARVRLLLRGEAVDMTLKEPQARVVIEIYARHAPGLVHLDGKEPEPTTNAICLVLKGNVVLAKGDKKVLLREPPGPASLTWDSYSRKPDVHHVDKLPDMVKPLDEKEKKILAEVCRCTAHLADKDVSSGLDKLLRSKEESDRAVGVICAGAVDDVGRLLEALADPKHAEVRDRAVTVTRHWLGRETGQMKKLFVAAKKKGWSAANAKTLVQLLIGFDDEQRGDPDTYAALISQLDHSQLAVRELARWHLFRLAPVGKGIAYDAAGPVAERRRAVEQWRALIPPGELPPAEKPKKDKK